MQKKIIFRSGVGVQGSLQTFFYCEVTDDMKTEQGRASFLLVHYWQNLYLIQTNK